MLGHARAAGGSPTIRFTLSAPLSPGEHVAEVVATVPVAQAVESALPSSVHTVSVAAQSVVADSDTVTVSVPDGRTGNSRRSSRSLARRTVPRVDPVSVRARPSFRPEPAARSSLNGHH